MPKSKAFSGFHSVMSPTRVTTDNRKLLLRRHRCQGSNTNYLFYHVCTRDISSTYIMITKPCPV